MKHSGLALAAFLVVVVGAISSCKRPNISEPEALQIAMAKIERTRSLMRIDPTKLPPLSGREVVDGFDFEVRDAKQNIAIFVHVSRTGLPELSYWALDQELRK